MSASPKIRAARLVQHGQPLRIEPVQLPEPGDDEVLVTLQFGGVNPVDRYLAEGRVAPDGPLPRTLGGEAAGTASGRPVLVAGEGLGAVRDGVWAQAAVVPKGAVVELPAGVEPREAAAMGIAGLTAYNVVRELAQVTADDRVLVLGASGGVGTMIVSLVAASGATVWGQIGSPAKAEVVERQGAERALVAGPDELTAALDDFEPTVVFDPLGGDFLGPVIDSLAVHGRLVSFGTSAGPEVKFNMQTLYRKGLSLLGYAGMQLGREQRRRGLEAALAALSEGQLRIVIDEVLALERVTEALERIERRQVRGKLLLALAE
jgi:NADPH2:quinone reductase